jgi:hypothetical protein
MKIIKRIGVMILGYTSSKYLVRILHMGTITCIVRSGEHTSNNNSMCAVDHMFPLTEHVFISVCSDNKEMHLRTDETTDGIQLSNATMEILKKNTTIC